MNILKAIYVILLVLSFGYIHAIIPLPQNSDPKAEKVLKDYGTSIQSVRDFAAEFVWETGNMRMGATKAGFVKYKKGMYMIDFPSDKEQIFCDKAQQWIFDMERGEVLQRDYDPYYGASLELIFESYKNKGYARYNGLEVIKGQNCHKVSISLREGTSAYSQIILWINQRSNLLEKAILLDYNNTTTTYTFSNFRLNRGFPDQDFRFDERRYPNVEVIKE